MKTREQLKATLEAALNSPNWQMLKKSMVGKELIAFGTEVLYQNQVVGDTFRQSLDYSTASLADLMQLGRRNDIPVSDKEPSWITVNRSTLTKPYATPVTIGSATFYPISYYRPNSAVTMYQGTTARTNVVSSMTHVFSSVDRVAPLNRVVIDDVSYIVLGENVMPESIRFFVNDSGVTREIPLYSPEVSQGIYVKCITLPDGRIVLDDSLVQNEPSYTASEVYFLELTFSEFNVSSNSTIVSYNIGGTSLDYARENYHNYIARREVLNSVDKIRAYCNTNLNVLDCSVVLDSTTKTIICYIKPKVTASTYDYMSMLYYLRLHADQFADYRVEVASPIKFNIILQDNLTTAQRAECIDMLESELAYDKLPFNKSLASSEVTNLIYDKTRVTNEVRLQIHETISLLPSGKLAGTASSSSLKLYYTSLLGDDESQYIGSDKDGSIYTNILDSQVGYTGRVVGESTGGVGKVIFFKEDLGANYDFRVYNVESGSFNEEAATYFKSKIVSGLNAKAFVEVYNATSDTVALRCTYAYTGSGGDHVKIVIFHRTSWFDNPVGTPTCSIIDTIQIS